MKRPRRIVLYAVNGAGLGHLTRLLGVARWLRRTMALLDGQVPEVIFLTSSEASAVLLRAGFVSFKLPSKTVVRLAGMDVLEYRRLARHFVWQTLGVFNPDLLVVDTFPAGSFDELLQLLDGPFHKAFIHREVKPEFAERPVFQAAAGLYDTIVSPHRPPEPPPGAPADAPPPSPFPGRAMIWTGEVLQFDRVELPARDAIRRSLGVAPGSRLIYVSAGGGGDPGAEAALEALAADLGQDPSLTLIVGAGPLYRGRRLGGPRLIWSADPGAFELMSACDAAVSAGGYNTFHELLYLRVPTVFFAQEKIADDQRRRIAQAAGAGACLQIEDLSQARGALARALDPAFARSAAAACEALLPENGAARCARALLSSLYDEDRLAWAGELLSPRLAKAFEDNGPEGLDAMARWLPQVVPHAQLDHLSARPSFQALVDQLSDAAADELRALVARDEDTQAMRRVSEHLGDLLALAPTWPGGVEDLTDLVGAAIKKHPLVQERDRLWMPWICTLIRRLVALLTAPRRHLSPAEVAQIYRVAPRLVDADAARALDLFEAALRRAGEAALGAPDLLQRLRVLKFAHKRVTQSLLETFAQGLAR